jgi:hypothetical protein
MTNVKTFFKNFKLKCQIYEGDRDTVILSLTVKPFEK